MPKTRTGQRLLQKAVRSYYRIFDTRQLRAFFVIAVVCAAAFAAMHIFTPVPLTPQQVTTQLTERVVSLCREGTDHTVCYEREVPKLFPEYSIPQLFDVVRNIRAVDHSYQFCHVLAHKLGEKVVEQDPDKWMQAMPLNPSDGLCSNGFTHGVVGGRFRANVLTDEALNTFRPDFRSACEPHDNWNPTPSIQATCYHGLGHLYVYITNAHLDKALELCEETAVTPKGDFGQVCREGVFMQIYQPLEPDDFEMIEQMPIRPSTTTVRQFCSSYSGNPKYEGACQRESWPFSRTGVMDGTGVEAFCSDSPNSDEELNCYRSAFSIIGRSSLGRGDAASRACARVPEVWQGVCITTVATTVLEENLNEGSAAIATCMQARSPSDAQTCLSQFADHAQFYFGSDPSARESFCRALPEPQRSTCLQ